MSFGWGAGVMGSEADARCSAPSMQHGAHRHIHTHRMARSDALLALHAPRPHARPDRADLSSARAKARAPHTCTRTPHRAQNTNTCEPEFRRPGAPRIPLTHPTPKSAYPQLMHAAHGG